MKNFAYLLQWQACYSIMRKRVSLEMNEITRVRMLREAIHWWIMEFFHEADFSFPDS